MKILYKNLLMNPNGFLKKTFIFYLLVVAILVCAVYQTLFTCNTSASLITLQHVKKNEKSPDYIPRIIHRTWKDDRIPKKWEDAYDHCQGTHQDYKSMFWTDLKARNFINEEYPWFLSTFDGYSYPIQRADAIRYFVLFHYGGIYMDLDVGCQAKSIRLDALLKYPAVIPKTKPIGYSNDVLASTQHHDFYKTLILNLKRWDHWYIFPYLTVFFSTGPMYLNIQYWFYKGTDPIWVLSPELYSEGSLRIFNHLEGSTWHNWDAYVIKFTYKVIGWFIMSSFLSLLVLFFIIFKTVKWWRRVQLEKWVLRRKTSLVLG